MGDDEFSVLLVDDEPAVAGVTSEFLEREESRIQVETAGTAREGLDRLADAAEHCWQPVTDADGRLIVETDGISKPTRPGCITSSRTSSPMPSSTARRTLSPSLMATRG